MKKSKKDKAKYRQYSMVVVDSTNNEHSTFLGEVQASLSEELIRECFEKRFDPEFHVFFFDWEEHWYDGGLSMQLSFEI